MLGWLYIISLVAESLNLWSVKTSFILSWKNDFTQSNLMLLPCFLFHVITTVSAAISITIAFSQFLISQEKILASFLNLRKNLCIIPKEARTRGTHTPSTIRKHVCKLHSKIQNLHIYSNSYTTSGDPSPNHVLKLTEMDVVWYVKKT